MLTNLLTRDHFAPAPARALARPGRRPFYMSACVAFMVLLLPAPAQALSNCTPLASWGSFEPTTAERVVALTNEHRASLGLRRLVVSPTLTRAATWKALHMVERNYYAHSDQGIGSGAGRPFWIRATDCGYPSWPYENLASGFEVQGNASWAVEGWLNSPAHRANIERTDIVATGVGIATSPIGATYWVQILGRDDDSGTPEPVPVAADSGRTIFGQPVLLPVLANDEPLAALHSIARKPTHGTVQIAGRRIRYTPKTGFVGVDRFSYYAAGLDGGKAQAQVTITVSPSQLKATLTAYHIGASSLARHHLSYSVTGRAVVRYRLYRVGQASVLRVGSPLTLTNSSMKVSLATVFGQTKRRAGQYRLVVAVTSGPAKTLLFRLT